MSEIRKNRIREAMETVLKAFESNPEKVALAIFRGNSKPSDGKWTEKIKFADVAELVLLFP